MEDESTKAELESRPFKQHDKGKKMCTENAPKNTHLIRNEKGALEIVEYERKNDKNGTFWTLCSYCYSMHEYEKVFEECCLVCQNCKKAFHGVAVEEPNKKMLVEGKDEYYCGLGYFALKFSLDSNESKMESGGEGENYNFVEISDDSDEGVNVETGERAKEDVLKRNVKNVMQGSGNTEVENEGKRVTARKNVKSVPRNSKKVMGRGVNVTKTDGGMGIGGSARGTDTGGYVLTLIYSSLRKMVTFLLVLRLLSMGEFGE